VLVAVRYADQDGTIVTCIPDGH